MIDATPEGLAALAARALPPEPPPEESQIADFLSRMAVAFQVPPDVISEARKLIHARFAIRMEKGETLVDEEREHVPWLDARRSAIDPFYWTRYKEMLVGGGWAPRVAATLDQSTNELLDLLGNPDDQRGWQRRGLVVGDVQSGKTATYAALVCKAADAGYRMVILLTGMLENVRRQTQERLDASIIGFDSSDFLGNAKLRHKRHIGVGLIDGRRDGVVFTSREHDFRKDAASALNISLSALNEPVLVVTKKNKAILERLANWLRARNVGRSGRIDAPMLLVDDEADNASVNTKKDPDETTAINKAIRDLLGLFERSSYVGFTATPFANIFIDPSSTSDMLGDDLFPRDFIHVLRAPDNYVGMDRLFGEADANVSGALSDQVIRPIADVDDWMPGGHKKDHDPGPLPGSLVEALQCFLLTCAIRDLRASAGTPGAGGGSHRSMLVNVSRFTAVQNTVAAALHAELEEIRQAVRLHAALGPAQAAAQSNRIAELASTFSKEFGSAGLDWGDVLEALHPAIAPVRIQPVNQGTGSKSLEYQGPNGTRVIAVGGNSLSRGLTLEGLSTSYFLRDARAYDTLMQMGRWFGYREGYGDLCRIWMTEEACGWFEHVTAATNELKRDFGRMKRRQATPREFGLRVRQHPGTLLITARNKMASGKSFKIERDISLMGRGIESARLYSGSRPNSLNVACLDRFLTALASQGILPEQSPHEGALIWRHVPVSDVAALLDEFRVHPQNFSFQADSIADFLRTRASAGDILSDWTIALPAAGDGRLVDELQALKGLTVSAAKRKVASKSGDGSLLVSGKASRVGGRPDLRHAFDKDELDALRKAGKTSTEDGIRKEMHSPLLVIYLLRGKHRPDGPNGQEVAFKDDMLLPAIGMHFPAGDGADEPRQLIKYRLNTVAHRDLLPEADGDDDDLPSQDDDEP